MSRTTRAALAVVAHYAASVTVAAAGFVLVPVVLSHVSREDYGLWATVGQAFAYLNLLDLGVGSALIRRTAQVRAGDDPGAAISRALSTGMAIFAGLGALVLVAGLGFAVALPKVLPLSAEQLPVARLILGVLVVYTALSFPLRAAMKTLQGLQAMATAHLLTMLEGLVTPVGAVLLLAAGVGLLALPIASAIGGSVAGLLAFLLVRRHTPTAVVGRAHVSATEARELFGWSALLWLNSLAVMVIYQTDTLVVASGLGLGAAAGYSLTTRLPMYALPVIVVLADSCVPAAVELSALGRRERLREVYLRVVRVTSVAAFGAALVASAVNGRFVTLWVGAENYGGVWLTVIVSLILVYRVLMQTAAVVILGVGRLRGVVVMSLLEAALNLALSLWWVRRYGPAGVAAATLAAGLLTSGWFVTLVTARLLEVGVATILRRSLATPLVCVLPAAVVAVLLRDQTARAGWVGLTLIAAALAGVYCVTALLVAMSSSEATAVWHWLPTLLRRRTVAGPDAAAPSRASATHPAGRAQ